MSESTRMMLGLAIGKKKEEWALSSSVWKVPLYGSYVGNLCYGSCLHICHCLKLHRRIVYGKT